MSESTGRQRTKQGKDTGDSAVMAETGAKPVPVSSMNAFFTREKANKGIKVYLPLPDGTLTESWVSILGIDSDGFRKKELELKRKAFSDQAESNVVDRVMQLEKSKLELITAMVLDWSFDEPCTEKNVRMLLTEAPQFVSLIDEKSADRALFFVEA